MPTVTPIDVVEPELELVAPQVPETEAIDVAIQYRLDLLNRQDRVDDAKRQVLVARNNLLPAFNLRGSVSADSDPDRKNSMIYSNENATWRGEAAMEIPLDRKAERNSYRSALIALRRAERNWELGRDQVRLDVRNALRQLEQARVSMEIQQRNIDINAFRKEQARALYDKGSLSSNRDVVEAENAYRAARNRFARAQSDYRAAVLEFLRDTGTLRVDDEGRLVRLESAATASAETRP
jgi:outer membrane protein TolC